jgi:hypothetical protein
MMGALYAADAALPALHAAGAPLPALHAADAALPQKQKQKQKQKQLQILRLHCASLRCAQDDRFILKVRT